MQQVGGAQHVRVEQSVAEQGREARRAANKTRHRLRPRTRKFVERRFAGVLALAVEEVEAILDRPGLQFDLAERLKQAIVVTAIEGPAGTGGDHHQPAAGLSQQSAQTRRLHLLGERAAQQQIEILNLRHDEPALTELLPDRRLQSFDSGVPGGAFVFVPGQFRVFAGAAGQRAKSTRG